MLKKNSPLPPSKREINAVFFSGFLFFVIAMSLSHFFLWKTPFTGIPLFFFLHAIGQCILEVGLLLLVGCLLKRWMRRWVFHAFIGFSFAILLAHFADFQIIRLMDASLSYICKYFFGSGIPHVLTAFQALNMNWTMTCLLFTTLLLIPLVGIGVYKATEPLSKKIAWKPSLPRLILTLFATSVALFLLDLAVHPFMNQASYTKFQKALPLGTTFLSPKSEHLILLAPLKPMRNEPMITEMLQRKKFVSADKPNIYFFVIETLRKDFLTPTSAPNLLSFARENFAPKESFSNANSTHPSWFAIFHSDFPYHWTHMREEWQEGSVPLRILKESGYKINVYSSSDLTYFNMDQLLFGKNRVLIDQMEDFSQIRFIEPYERDFRVVETLLKDLESPARRTGHVFIVFFDATHSEYSVPPNDPPIFQPALKEIDYLTLTPTNIEPLKNRYRNAIFYIDSLMGKFFRALNERKLYADSIIAITGDHGEEFFEDGALFHGTHLNHYQTSVPIFCKFQKNPWVLQSQSATHIDLFPTIIHHLTGRLDFEHLFDGQSLFAPNRWPYRLAVLQNGPKTPAEFSIAKEGEFFQFRFPDIRHIYQTKELEILQASIPPDEAPDLLKPLLHRE